jgi:type I restriction enzyme, S subunit
VQTVKLKDLCDFEKGATGLAKAEPGAYPLITTGAERKSCNTYQFDEKAVCIPLVSSTGHGHASLKNVHYQEGKFALGSILVALTSKDSSRLDIQFLHLYLSQLKDQVLVPLMSGAANVALSVKKIQNIEIPLPSIERQREIVEKFKSIVAEDDELKSELTQQQNLLKKLRQKILQEAIEGKLTADWRAQNSDVEPARKLLKRIAVEKAKLVKDKKIKGQKPLPPISADEKPFELPQGWAWTQLGDLAQVLGGKRVPQGHKLIESRTEHKYARVLNLTNGTIEGSFKYLTTDAWKKISNYTILKDDLYITIAGTIGRCGIVPDDLDGINLTENSSKLCLYLKHNSLKKFILISVQSQLVQSQFIAKVYGMAMPKLALKRIQSTFIPLPPLMEQQAIVTKVEKLLSLCDQLEAQITQNQSHADQLMQAVLEEAFSHNNEGESAATKSKASADTPEVIRA